MHTFSNSLRLVISFRTYGLYFEITMEAYIRFCKYESQPIIGPLHASQHNITIVTFLYVNIYRKLKPSSASYYQNWNKLQNSYKNIYILGVVLSLRKNRKYQWSYSYFSYLFLYGRRPKKPRIFHDITQNSPYQIMTWYIYDIALFFRQLPTYPHVIMTYNKLK